MEFRKTIVMLCAVALLPLKMARAEEQHSIMTPLSSTTLTGYVDTSILWWLGMTGIPANDLFASALSANAAKVPAPVNLTAATLEAGEPVSPQQTGSVWYKWNVGAGGLARIAFSELAPFPAPQATSTMPTLSHESIFHPWGGINYDGGGGSTWSGSVGTQIDSEPIINLEIGGYRQWWARLAAYRGTSLSDLALVQTGRYLEFSVQTGETIWICLEVYKTEPAYEGEPLLPSNLPESVYFDVTPPPINNSFDSSLSVADSAGGTMTGHLAAATRETGEPELGAEYSGGSVWFHYTAATYGVVSISDVSQHVSIAIFTGSEVSNLQLVAKSSAGGIAFFGVEGTVYHIAVYTSAHQTTDFHLTFHGPRYRLYETTVDALMPLGLVPHVYGVRGVTMLLYAKSAAGWDCVEIEPIINEATDLLIRPLNAIDGKLRVITIDEAMPSPRVNLRLARNVLVPDLVGFPGQTCAVSFSSDLVNWSQPKVYTLQEGARVLEAVNPGNSALFYRVTQSRPVVNRSSNQLEAPD